MKPAPLILAATLLCNAALVGIALVRLPALPDKAIRASSPSLAPSSADPRTLAQLFASDDTRALLERLHEKGIPPDILRTVAYARLEKKYAARRAALEDPPLPYWREESRLPKPKPDLAARRAEKLALDNEMNADFKDITVGLIPDSEPRDAAVRRAYGNLPDAKIAQIAAINRDYDDMRFQLYDDMNGVRLPGDQAQLDLLNKEQRADLAQALTPDELRDYDLRSSPLAKNLQQRIKYFNSTEAEYTALYDAQTVINEQTAGKNLSDAELRQLRDAAAKDILTPDRYEEYKIATTPSYEDVSNLVIELNLPQTAVAQIITTQNTISAQAGQIRNDTTLAPADRDAQLAALAQNAQQQLGAILDEQGMTRYQHGPAGAWLRQLQPKQPKPSNP